jgi:hypothetical protein
VKDKGKTISYRSCELRRVRSKAGCFFIFMMVGLNRVVHHSSVVSTTTMTATHYKISNMAQHTSNITEEISTAQPECSLNPSKLDDSALGRFRTSLGSSGGVLDSE